MLLESLLKLVETLRSRAQTHGDALRSSEALTRYALIDPLLRELGWDTADPAVVAPEYRSGSGSADYALLVDGSPAMMVEAKKLGTPLQDNVILQVLNYCQMEGTKHFAITDGARWSIYDTHKPVPMNEKRVVEFDLANQPPAEVCLKALALWRPSVQSGYVAPGNTPIPAPEPTPTPTPTPIPDSGEWQPFEEISSGGGEQPPKEILFPDRRRTEMKYWTDILVETVRWLTDKGILTNRQCPMSRPRTRRYMVHTEPVHSHGANFASPVQVNGLYVEKNVSAPASISHAIAIITHVGQDPAQFRVRFD